MAARPGCAMQSTRRVLGFANMQKTKFIVSAVLGIAIVASGCAKASLTQQQANANSGQMFSQALQPPAPDQSYSAQQTSQIASSGTNVSTYLVQQIFDKVAIALRETNMHLGQTISQGATSNNGMTITLPSLGTTLTGTSNAAAGTITYAYNMTGSTFTGANNSYFTGTVGSNGTTGNFSFPGGSGSAALTVNYTIQNTSGQLVKNVTISNATWGSINFVETFTSNTIPDSVTMTYTIGGPQKTGSWTAAAGGSFTDVTGTKRCFNASLQDVNPCN